MKRLTQNEIDCLVCLSEPERFIEREHGVYVVRSSLKGEIFGAFHPSTREILKYYGLIKDGRLTERGKIAADTGNQGHGHTQNRVGKTRGEHGEK